MIREYMTSFYLPSFIVIILAILAGAGIGVSVGNGIWGSNASIALTYALDCIVDTSKVGATGICYPAGEFSVFWQEVTKNTTFTVDGKPVEITDVQVFYRTDSHCTISDTGIGTILYDCKCYKNGNITYYPQGIENSQTYVVPTPSPTPCAWSTERTAYSFCGKVIVNSSAEFDILLKDIEKHSYHIQMGWMHLDYEYAHNTYDNTFPAPVNVTMGIIPSDNFPIGSEWEERMVYTVGSCPPFGSCDFDTLALSTPTPTCTCEDK